MSEPKMPSRKIRTKDDLLEWIGNEVWRVYDRLEPHRDIEIVDLIGELQDSNASKEVFELLETLHSYKWTSSVDRGQRVEITKTGIVRLAELRERRLEDASLPWIERFLRRKTKMWGVTVSTIVQIVTVIIALIGLVVSFIALRGNL